MPEKRLRLPPMIRLLYQALLWLSLPAVLLRLEWRARREPEYGQRIGERMGRVPAEVPVGCIWFHAVSAGETIAAAPLIAKLASEFSGDGGVPFLVTTMTPTGSAQVAGRLGGSVHHCYAPYDFPFGVRSFFDGVQPRLLVLVETELWPNLIGEAHRRGVPVLLVNARLSERSARGYGLVRGLTRRMLKRIGFVACQYDDDADRFRLFGLDDDKVAAFGSVKFDAGLPDDHAARVAALRREFALERRPVWLAASTHPGEEEFALAAHARVRDRHPEACLLLVPRHPVRALEICALAQRRGFKVRETQPHETGQLSAAGVHRSAAGEPAHAAASALRIEPAPAAASAPGIEPAPAEASAPGIEPAPAEASAPGIEPAPAEASASRIEPVFSAAWAPRMEPALAAVAVPSTEPADIFVCNTMGRLQYLYGLSEIAFLGGSLVPVGGHNPIEPALCRQPLVTGPHTWNFADVFAAFAATDCLARVESAEQLAAAVIAAFEDADARNAAGERAWQVVEENRGATARLLELLRARIRAAIA